MIDDSVIASVAASNGIPPAVLSALASRMSNKPAMGMNTGALSALGFTSADLAQDENLTLELAARSLKQGFSQSKSWEGALSYYLTGDAKAYTNPNSSTGGSVFSILGGAANNPETGLQGLSPQQINLMMPGLQSLGQYLKSEVATGGIVTQQKLDQFNSILPGGTYGNGPGAGAFPGDIYPTGQCTWLVAGLRPDINSQGSLGNAGQWPVNSQTPTPGAAVVYNGGDGYSSEGHVGVVTKVNSDGTFEVLSDNWGTPGEIHLGNSTMSDVKGFIAPTSSQQGQQVAAQALKVSGDPQAQQQVVSQAQQTATRSQQSAPKAQTAGPKVGTDTKAQPKPPHEQTPTPKEVNNFAQAVKGLGIDLNKFTENFGMVAKMFRSQGGATPTLQQYATASQMDPSQQLEYVRSQPHPKYPFMTLGTMADTFASASLHSLANLTRMPHEAEVVRLATAGANWPQMQQWYQGIADKKQGAPAGAQPQGAQQSNPQAPSSPQQQGQPKAPLGAMRAQ